MVINIWCLHIPYIHLDSKYEGRILGGFHWKLGRQWLQVTWRKNDRNLIYKSQISE